MSNNKYKILVIEDEGNIRHFVQTVLEANSYQVLTAGSGSHGSLMFRSHLPDLVILDLGLPDMDGLDFIRAIRKSSVTPIIILSARTQEHDKVTALEYVTMGLHSEMNGNNLQVICDDINAYINIAGMEFADIKEGDITAANTWDHHIWADMDSGIKLTIHMK